MPEATTARPWRTRIEAFRTLAAERDDASAAPSAQAADAEASIRWSRVLCLSAAFFLIFYTVEHNAADFAGLQIADLEEDNIKDDFIDKIEGGSSARKIVLTGYGVGGLFALALCRQRAWNLRRSGVFAVGALLLWIIASLSWSIEPELTFRRIVASGMIVVGSLGFARALRPNELLAVALITFSTFVGASLLLELGAGGRPWVGDYRFGGTLHPNIQAAYCGMLCLAAFSFPSQWASRWLTLGLLAFGFTMLLQTQSRTSTMAVLVGMLMVFVIRLSPMIRWWTTTVLAGVAALVTIVIGSLSDGGQKQLTDAILLGRTEQAGSLTGRVPLWEELSTYAASRPLTGYGYESFWTPDNVAAVMKSQEWALQSAHNAYFETVLQLGFTGLLLAVGLLLIALNLQQVAYSRTQSAGYAFAYGLLGFAMANSFLESHFAKLKYPTVIAVIAVLSVVAFFPQTAEDDGEGRKRFTRAGDIAKWRRLRSGNADSPSVGGRRRA